MNKDLMQSISDGMAGAVDIAAGFTVLVNARKRLPVSGVIVKNGFILTVDHGIEIEEHIQVVLPGDVIAEATLVGRDPGSDLAVLRVNVETGAGFTASAPAKVGQPVIAIGKPELNGVQASFGIVTALGEGLRTVRGSVIEKYIATDATPYPGFSGGPLLTLTGEVLGLNTSGLVGGSSLAIPIQQALAVMEQLAAHGKVRRGYLGIRSQAVDLPAGAGLEQKTGLLLVGVDANEPAGQGGLIVGDILIGINAKMITNQDDLFVCLSSDIAGKEADVNVLRGGQPQVLRVTVGERI